VKYAASEQLEILEMNPAHAGRDKLEEVFRVLIRQQTILKTSKSEAEYEIARDGDVGSKTYLLFFYFQNFI
jgi:hypothetical protein